MHRGQMEETRTRGHGGDRGNCHGQQQETVDYTHSYILLSLFIALSFAVIIIRWIRQDPSIVFCYHVYIIALISVSCFIMYCCRRTNLKHVPSHADEDTRTTSIISPLAFIGMVVFLVGCTLFDAVSMTATAECLRIFQIYQVGFKATSVVVLMTIILKPVYMAIQIAFLSWSGKWLARYRQIQRRGVFLFNGFTNITLILYSVFYESREVFKKTFSLECVPGNESRISSARPKNANLPSMVEACQNRTTDYYKVETKLESYLFSFHAEFYVLATSLNLIAWKWFGRRHRPTAEILGTNTEIESIDLSHITEREESVENIQGGHQDIPTPRNDTQTIASFISWFRPRREESEPLLPGTKKNSNTCARACQQNLLFGLFGLIVFSVYFLLLFLKTHNTEKFKVNIPLYLYAPFVFLCSALVNVYLYCRLNKILQQGVPVRRLVSIESGVLIISAFGCNLFNMIYSVSALYLMLTGTTHGDFFSHVPNCVPYLIDLVSALTMFVQIGFQTRNLFFIHWSMARGNHYDVFAPGVEQAAVFLMVMNLAEWTCDTLVETKYLGLRATECQYFGARTWDVIIQCLFSFILYFRFHSCMAFAEYLLWRWQAAKKMKSPRNDLQTVVNNQLTITSFI